MNRALPFVNYSHSVRPSDDAKRLSDSLIHGQPVKNPGFLRLFHCLSFIFLAKRVKILPGTFREIASATQRLSDNRPLILKPPQYASIHKMRRPVRNWL